MTAEEIRLEALTLAVPQDRAIEECMKRAQRYEEFIRGPEKSEKLMDDKVSKPERRRPGKPARTGNSFP